MEPLIQWSEQISSFTSNQLIYIRSASVNQLKNVIDITEINIDCFHAFEEHRIDIDFNSFKWYKNSKNQISDNCNGIVNL